MALVFETFLPQSCTTHSLNGFVFGGRSLPLLVFLADRFAVHSPQ